MKRTSGAKPNTKMVIKGGTVKKSSQADQLKLQGNAFFISLDYVKAIDCYTRCLPYIPDSDHNLRTIVYSNRAQCQLKQKKYELAFQDADMALSIDANHLKSIQRRGTAAYYTQRLRQARKDFMHSLSIEYSDVTKDYLVKVNQGIQKVKLEAYDKLRKKVTYSSGIDYLKGEDNDQAKSNGVNDFKNKAVKIEIKEMNLDAK
mgnify:CR=1 FL=1